MAVYKREGLGGSGKIYVFPDNVVPDKTLFTLVEDKSAFPENASIARTGEILSLSVSSQEVSETSDTEAEEDFVKEAEGLVESDIVNGFNSETAGEGAPETASLLGEVPNEAFEGGAADLT